MRYQETTAEGRRRRSVCNMPTFRSYVLGVVVVEGVGEVKWGIGMGRESDGRKESYYSLV